MLSHVLTAPHGFPPGTVLLRVALETAPVWAHPPPLLFVLFPLQAIPELGQHRKQVSVWSGNYGPVSMLLFPSPASFRGDCSVCPHSP